MTASRSSSRTRFLLGAALAGCLAAPALAHAQERPPALLVTDQAGRPIGVLVPAPAESAPAEADPLLRMMALQQAMLRQMQDRLASLDVPDDAAAPDATASLTISSVSTSSDGCSHTVVWRQDASDPAPKLVLDRIADRCAATVQAPAAHQEAAPAAPGNNVPTLTPIVDRHAPAPRTPKPF